MKKTLIKEDFSTENLYNKFNLLTEAEVKRITLGIDWTLKNYPEAVIIGGSSVVYYLNGGRDLTPDLDYMIGNINYIKTMLDKDKINYSPIKSSSGNIGITASQFNIDYLDANTGNVTLNKLILNNYITGNINGRNCKIVIPELLTIMKIELGRDKDTTDGLALITSKKLDKIKYLKFVNMLKNNLNEYESLISYAEMI
jgi:hypothetical protein